MQQRSGATPVTEEVAPRWWQTPRIRSGALLALFYALAVAMARGSGHTLRIPWSYYQLLDRNWLSQYPAESLLLLHGQPPGLNAILAVILQLSGALGVSPESLADVLFFGVGAAIVCLTFELVLGTTHRRALAFTAVCVTLLDPGFRYFQALFFYTFLVNALLLALLLLSLRYLQTGRSAVLALIVVCLTAVSLTRTLYAPWWAALFFGLLLVGRARVVGGLELKKAVISGALLIASLCVWPAKNAWIFDSFTYSSWSGHNLSRNIPLEHNPVNEFFGGGPVSPELKHQIHRMRAAFGPEVASVVIRRTKEDGSRNWNHLIFLEANRPMRTAAIAWRLDNPGATLMMAAEQYFMWARASHIHPYRGTDPSPHESFSGQLAGLYRTVFFADLRPLIEKLPLPGTFDAFSTVRNQKVPFTFFALVAFPGLVTGYLWLVSGRRSQWRPESICIGLALYCVLWSLVIPCFSDGVEGNRMRYSAGGLMIAAAFFLIRELPRAFARHASRIGDGASTPDPAPDRSEGRS